jgi:hypothetical protein
MKKYKSLFTEADQPKNNDFRVTFTDSGDRSVGIPSAGDEIFVIFRHGDWMPDFVNSLKEDIAKWCQDVSEGKCEYKVEDIDNPTLSKAISNIPEQRLPSSYDED